MVGGAEGSRMWGLSVGIAMLVVALLSPVLGALADFSATKKRVLFVFTAISCIFTAMLFFVEQGDIFTGMLFFILAEIGYRGAQVFYNSLLPDIAEPDQMGKVSGNGWAIGSFGGIVCLGIVLALILTIKGAFIVRFAFLITAAFYALATMPVFLFVRERSKPQPLPKGVNYLSISFKKLANTFQSARQYKEFIKFLVAFLIYNNGIMMLLDFAAIIGAVLFGMNQQQLIIFVMIVQVTSVIGAYLFGLLAHRLGGKLALILSIGLMALTVTGLFFVHSLVMFNVIGALAGFALTGVQSVSRTVVGQVCPPEKAAEFYGLFSLASQISNFTGPSIYGLLATALALRYYEPRGFTPHAAEAAGMEAALFSIVGFLVAGLAFLLFVKNWQRAK
ncbi:MAG: MFS transporter [Chloroflexi bacterium]|nr:MAG: MFS transporter [Chloroflexota bacterium]